MFMMDLVFYTKNGLPYFYSENGIELFLFTGEPVGYIEGKSIYSYSGRHFGWFTKGFVRDNFGDVIFYTSHTEGIGPITPPVMSVLDKAPKKLVPLKQPKHEAYVIPKESFKWSRINYLDFFRF